jgi:tetraacyldisaccharide 4'-kinase
VDENRVRGVKKLLKTARPPQVFLLDDAFQHRRISPGLSLLLTDYSSLYTHDSLLPGGNLRECKNASNRADIVVVTKCPDDISALNMRLVQKLIPIKSYQSLFFSTFVYGTIQPAFGEKLLVDITFKQLKERNYSVLLLAAIANPSLMLNYLKQFTNNIESIFYRDHHFFSGKDIKRIEEKFESLPTKNKIIITTEKDAARMDENFPNSLKYNIYTLPVTVKFINNQEQTFINKIKNYVAEDSRNS